MRNVADAAGAHEGNALASLLGVNRSDRGGKRAGMLPERIGRAIHQMREDHGGYAVVAKDGDGIVVGRNHLIVISVADVAVARKERIKFTAGKYIAISSA